MAMTLIINGRPLVQPAPYCMSDREAAQAAELGRIAADHLLAIEAERQARAGLPVTALQPAQPAPARRVKRESQLLRLHEDGRLTLEQVRAGDEIARGYFAITAQLHARVTANYGERTSGSGGSDRPTLLGEDAWLRYCVWRDWSGAILVRDRLTLAGLTIDMVADNLGLRQARNRFAMRSETVAHHLQRSLGMYAEFAGWVPAGCVDRPLEKAA